jgi:hypothetical protein
MTTDENLGFGWVSIKQDVHAVFSTQIAQSDSDSLHVIVKNLAGFHMKQEN